MEAGSTGTFDPLTMTLEIHGNVDLENIGYLIKNNSTIFHEVVHSWQVTSTTSGMLAGCTRPLQLELASQFAHGNVRSLPKPIIEHFSARRDSDRSEYIVSGIQYECNSQQDEAVFAIQHYYFELEKLNAALDDPDSFDKSETEFVLLAFPGRPNYRLGLDEALLGLISIFREDIAVQLEPLRWPGKRGSLELSFSNVRGHEWIKSGLGLSQIQEAHARFLEMQLIALKGSDSSSLDYFRNSKMLGNRYWTGFQRYLDWANIDTPNDILDWRVHLFVLICEYSLNPTVPYVDGRSENFCFDDFHPGSRFAKACEAIRKSPALAAKNFCSKKLDHRSLLQAYEAIEDAANPDYVPSLKQATADVAHFAEECFSTNALSPARPITALLARHLESVVLRAHNPAAYLNPLTLVEGGSTLDFLLPPMVRTSRELLFTSPPGFSGPEGSHMFSFLIGLAYADVVSQLISTRGPFSFEHRLIPADLKDLIYKGVEQVFERDFGFPLHNVAVI